MVQRVWVAHRGPQHVIIDCCEGMVEDLGFDPRGMPTREVYDRPGDDAYLRLMDRVYATGEPLYIPHAPAIDGTQGRLVIAPLRDEHGIWGVTLLWKARVARPHAMRPPASPAIPVALPESA